MILNLFSLNSYTLFSFFFFAFSKLDLLRFPTIQSLPYKSLIIIKNCIFFFYRRKFSVACCRTKNIFFRENFILLMVKSDKIKNMTRHSDGSNSKCIRFERIHPATQNLFSKLKYFSLEHV